MDIPIAVPDIEDAALDSFLLDDQHRKLEHEPAESGQFWSQSPPLRRALAEDTADGIWGVALLITGILIQFLAVAGIVIFPFWNCLV
jgi:hypothetical protein